MRRKKKYKAGIATWLEESGIKFIEKIEKVTGRNLKKEEVMTKKEIIKYNCLRTKEPPM